MYSHIHGYISYCLDFCPYKFALHFSDILTGHGEIAKPRRHVQSHLLLLEEMDTSFMLELPILKSIASISLNSIVRKAKIMPIKGLNSSKPVIRMK